MPSFFSKDAEVGYNTLVQDIRGYRARNTEQKPSFKELPTRNLQYHVAAVKIVVTAILTSIGVAIGYTIWVFVSRWF